MSKGKKTLTFRYVYPDDLRDYYVNGAWGGTTPRNEINMHFYSERRPIPKTVTHKIKDDETVGDQLKPPETGGDVVRLIQASVIMDIDTAIRIRNLLDSFIQHVQTQSKKG